ncbi:MBL fold metallo-hydrolase [Lentisalinibacter sediminis]|uniref:MBL fold metallo-hydrolase n=1 Tax=Lentisalinibacter sediminis TaxID=2992237 RepID=UPI00386587EA
MNGPETSRAAAPAGLGAGLLLACLTLVAGNAAAASCPGEGIAVQVLGSGGPIADDARASTGYIVWMNGESRVLIDAGAGAFLRFGEVGADFAQLGFVGLSHFHTDHSADFPALLKSGFFSDRSVPLRLAGPSGSDRFPDLEGFLRGLLSPEAGAYRYLSGYLDGDGGLPALDTVTVTDQSGTTRVFDGEDSLVIDAMHVPHGIVPALAFRVRIGEMSIVFAGDQNGAKDAFVDFARKADLLVMHMAIPEGVGGPASRLHATPREIGRVAGRVGARKLVLSHFMARSLRDLDGNVDRVRKHYDGPVIAADDLDCFPLP